ncbi:MULTISPECIES: hypothetical protein [unclassified Microbacterium]|uniref:hypothetical protein n=1 Tax=unclassified Microbacterium TaxID=2609290 RepID=UPI003018BCC7
MSRRASIWRWQLIFVSTTVAIAVLVAALKPTVFATPLFTAGLVLALLTTIVALVLPWERIPPAAILVVPMVDIAAIGLTTRAPDIRLGFLWVIPITWIATYSSMIAVLGGIALITAFLFTIANQSGVVSDVVLPC